MKNKKIFFLAFLAISGLFLFKFSYASEIIGTLSSGNPNSQTNQINQTSPTTVIPPLENAQNQTLQGQVVQPNDYNGVIASNNNTTANNIPQANNGFKMPNLDTNTINIAGISLVLIMLSYLIYKARNRNSGIKTYETGDNLDFLKKYSP